MKIERCEKGHFYDSDSFSRCPHCEKENSRKKNSGEVASGRKAEKSKNVCGGAGSRLSSGRKSETPPEYELETVFLGAGQGADGIQTPAVSPLSAVKKISSAMVCDAEAEEGDSGVGMQEAADASPADTSEQAADCGAEAAAIPDQPDAEEAPQEQVRDEAKPDESGAGESGEQAETIGAFTSFTNGSCRKDPPAGWFVCVGGPGWGEIYTIKSGGNTIGRSQTNDIVLEGDDRVSREKHARVVYEPRNRVFYIEAGERSGLTYLNGENILHHATLSAYDKIEMGGGTYLFIPLCGETFGWEDFPFRKDDA